MEAKEENKNISFCSNKQLCDESYSLQLHVLLTKLQSLIVQPALTDGHHFVSVLTYHFFQTAQIGFRIRDKLGATCWMAANSGK